jgi:hypothetical protein
MTPMTVSAQYQLIAAYNGQSKFLPLYQIT